MQSNVLRGLMTDAQARQTPADAPAMTRHITTGAACAFASP
jgi:hypothetical protein